MDKTKWKIALYIILGLAFILMLPIVIAGKPWSDNGYYQNVDGKNNLFLLLDLDQYDLSIDGIVEGDLTLFINTHGIEWEAMSQVAGVRESSLYFGVQSEVGSKIGNGKIALTLPMGQKLHFKKVMNPLSLYYYMYVNLTCKRDS